MILFCYSEHWKIRIKNRYFGQKWSHFWENVLHVDLGNVSGSHQHIVRHPQVSPVDLGTNVPQFEEIFEEISTLVHWIFERQTQVPFVHYLDDYLWGHINKMHCQLAFDTVQSTAQDIGLLLSPEKLVPPTQFIHFLGLGIDTVKWLVVVLEDKWSDIVNMLQITMAIKKVTVKHLQSLAGKLNFITRAVPQGRAVSARIYQESKDLRSKWHILVTKELRKDLQMWLCFLQHFGGCSSISVPSSPVVEIYTDTSTNPNLGWGGVVQ